MINLRRDTLVSIRDAVPDDSCRARTSRSAVLVISNDESSVDSEVPAPNVITSSCHLYLPSSPATSPPRAGTDSFDALPKEDNPLPLREICDPTVLSSDRGHAYDDPALRSFHCYHSPQSTSNSPMSSPSSSLNLPPASSWPSPFRYMGATRPRSSLRQHFGTMFCGPAPPGSSFAV